MTLELKLSPPILFIAIGCGMWGAAQLDSLVTIPANSIAGVVLMLAGLVLNSTAFFTFRKAKTTFNPKQPDTATTLVSSGIFGFSRNPMYLGMFIMLLGWAVFWSSLLALIGPVIFLLYINQFQIVPEERALSKLFGENFSAYKAKVRRWI